jgi:hypothetical protein
LRLFLEKDLKCKGSNLNLFITGLALLLLRRLGLVVFSLGKGQVRYRDLEVRWAVIYYKNLLVTKQEASLNEENMLKILKYFLIKFTLNFIIFSSIFLLCIVFGYFILVPALGWVGYETKPTSWSDFKVDVNAALFCGLIVASILSPYETYLRARDGCFRRDYF